MNDILTLNNVSSRCCRVGKTWPVNCLSGPGEVCRAVEGSFVTECEIKNCSKVC